MAQGTLTSLPPDLLSKMISYSTPQQRTRTQMTSKQLGQTIRQVNQQLVINPKNFATQTQKISTLPNLRKIIIEGDRMKEEDLEKILSSILSNKITKLKIFKLNVDLDYNKYFSPNILELVFQILTKNLNLEILSLRHLAVKVDDDINKHKERNENFSKILKQLKNLKDLDLGYCNIGLGLPIFKSLKNMNNLKCLFIPKFISEMYSYYNYRLYIKYNPLDFLKFIIDHLPLSLEELDISDIGLYPSFVSYGQQQISVNPGDISFSSLQNLRHFHYNKNSPFIPYLKDLPTSKLINLSLNHMEIQPFTHLENYQSRTTQKVSFLNELLKNCKKLELLDISSNFMEIKYLLMLLKDVQIESLKTLNLGGSSFDQMSIKFLNTLITKQFPSLKKLDIDSYLLDNKKTSYRDFQRIPQSTRNQIQQQIKKNQVQLIPNNNQIEDLTIRFSSDEPFLDRWVNFLNRSNFPHLRILTLKFDWLNWENKEFILKIKFINEHVILNVYKDDSLFDKIDLSDISSIQKFKTKWSEKYHWEQQLYKKKTNSSNFDFWDWIFWLFR